MTDLIERRPISSETVDFSRVENIPTVPINRAENIPTVPITRYTPTIFPNLSAQSGILLASAMVMQYGVSKKALSFLAPQLMDRAASMPFYGLGAIIGLTTLPAVYEQLKQLVGPEHEKMIKHATVLMAFHLAAIHAVTITHVFKPNFFSVNTHKTLKETMLATAVCSLFLPIAIGSLTELAQGAKTLASYFSREVTDDVGEDRRPAPL